MKAPSVLFINRVYPPAEGATGQLLAELAPELIKAGWDVTVVTSRATGTAPRSEKVEGVRVERVGSLSFTRASQWQRALSYLTLYPALLWRALCLPRADVVVTLTDPPLQLLLGPVLKRIKASRLVHWAQDIYPEVAEQLNVISTGGWLARLCRGLSTWGLRRHDRIIAVGRCMERQLGKRSLPEAIVQVIPNWAHATHVFPIEHAANPFRREHGLGGRFVVMYSGNFGLAHPFDAILGAAEMLQRSKPEVLFLFIGAGPRLEWVRKQVERLGLVNIKFLPQQPLEKVAESLSAADLHLASMLENLCGLVVPSKVYGILAAGRPCVLLGPKESEVAQTIEQNECGSIIVSPTGSKLAECVTEWAANTGGLRGAGQRAQRAAKASSLFTAVAAFDETLRGVCARPRNKHPAQLAECSLAPQQIPNSTHT
jgi:glycosyltransferase involved in cell wall biosynthesis